MSISAPGNPDAAMPTNRRALEALRSGVPNRDAVAALGSNQPAVEADFRHMLELAGAEPRPQAGHGMLVAGEFGAGKSHLLGGLEALALEQDFVCSRVVVSKETPLFDLGKAFRAAVFSGRVPDTTGQMVEELAQRLDPNSDRYREFSRWAHEEDSGLHRIFPATLTVHEHSRDQELASEIAGYWSGERMAVGRVRHGLREAGQLAEYPFRAPLQRDLPPQRLRFVLELVRAAGYRGWVVLVDEIELVANYSILQRARSYAEMARWMGRDVRERYPGLVFVGTVTADFAAVVLDEKGDRERVVPRLRDRGRAEDSLAASRAEIGMRLLQSNQHLLAEPTGAMLGDLYGRLREIHSRAYGWPAPDISTGIGQPGRRTIRSFVRRWIHEWDLRRLYPDAEPEIEENALHFSYREDSALEEAAPEDGAAADGPGAALPVQD